MGSPEQRPVQPPQQDVRRSSIFSSNPQSDTPKPNGKTRREALGILGGTVGGLLIATNAESIIDFFSSKERLPQDESADNKTKKFVTLYNNMLDTFERRDGLLKERNGEFNSTAPIWSFSRALDAAFVGSFLPGKVGRLCSKHHQEWLKKSEEYWSTFPEGEYPGYDPGPMKFNSGIADRYNDDNLWMGLHLATYYKQSGDERAIKRAAEIFAMLRGQLDTEHGGGYFWKMQRKNNKRYSEETAKGRGAVSNAPLIELAIELFTNQITYDPDYLTRAIDTYQWLKKTLVDGKENPLDNKEERKFDGLLFDNINENGHIGFKKWSYGQGAMIGALVKLSEVDPNPEKPFLQEAMKLAEASLSYFEINGYDEDNKKEKGVNAFNAIFFKNLLYLSTKVNDRAFTQKVKNALQERVDRLADSYDNLLEHAGAVHLAALNCLPPDHCDKLC